MSSDKKEIKVRAVMIIEVLGRPPEHLKETLEDFAKKIGEEKGVKVIDKRIMEPNLVKDQKDLYTTFMEIEVETESPMHLAGLVFRYMPAHVEVVSPENMVLNNNSFSEILSEVVRRLHRYDDIVRVLNMQYTTLQNKLKEYEGKPIEQDKVQEEKKEETNTVKKEKKVSKKKK
jgi:hypothetical protein